MPPLKQTPLKLEIICPNCEDTIDYVSFNVHISGTAYGTESFPLDGHHRDYNDEETDNDDELTYTCPHCSDSISKQDINTQINQITTDNFEILHPKKAQIKKDTPQKNIAENNLSLHANQRYHSRFKNNLPFDPFSSNNNIIECPKCKYEFTTETFPDGLCTKCNYHWIIDKKELINTT